MAIIEGILLSKHTADQLDFDKVENLRTVFGYWRTVQSSTLKCIKQPHKCSLVCVQQQRDDAEEV